MTEEELDGAQSVLEEYLTLKNISRERTGSVPALDRTLPEKGQDSLRESIPKKRRGKPPKKSRRQ